MPIQLKGRVIERKPVALLKPKSSAKKGGMRGGGIDDIEISLGNCGRSGRFGFWKNGCITLSHNDKKVVLYYNEDTMMIEVRFFENRNNNVYNKKQIYEHKNFNIKNVNDIILYLIGDIKTDKNKNSTEFKEKCNLLLSNKITNDNKRNIIVDSDNHNIKLINKIIYFISNSNKTDRNPKYSMIKTKLNDILIQDKGELEKAIKLCKSFRNLREII